MTPYGDLARAYDSLMPPEAYAAWAECCHTLFAPREFHSVLDLACGTGRLSWLLAEKGYEVVGVDRSSEMLAEAASQPEHRALGEPPLFICQSMEELDLFGTVQAAVCSMDSVNYLSPALLPEVFRRVRLFLEPGGLFLFDVHTPEKLRSLDGETFVSESEDAFCVWSAECTEDGLACDYAIDLFTREGRLWRRSSEEHREYAHRPEDLRSLLLGAGFRSVQVCCGLPLREKTEEDERLFFLAEG